MDKQTIVTIGLALGFIVPISITGYVILHSDNSLNGNLDSMASLHFQDGPGYDSANQAGFMRISYNNSLGTASTLNFTQASSNGKVTLLNVLVVNSTVRSGSSVSFWLNGTLPAGTTMLLSNSQLSAVGSSIVGKVSTYLNGTFSDHVTVSGTGQLFYAGFVSTLDAPAAGFLQLKHS